MVSGWPWVNEAFADTMNSQFLSEIYKFDVYLKIDDSEMNVK